MTSKENQGPTGPNWTDIKRCPIWKVIGVTECNSCDTKEQCWGTDSTLLETDSKNPIKALVDKSQ